MNVHTITDRRLISSILSEITLLGVEILVMDGENVLSGAGGMLLVDPPSGDKCLLIDGVSSSTQKIYFEFILNGKRFIGTSSRVSDHSLYFSLPDEMKIEERRGRIRYEFDKDRGCEVIFNHKTIPGIPVNFTQDYFACVVSSEQADEFISLDGVTGSVVVYGFDCSRGLTLPRVSLVHIRRDKQEATLVFKIESKSGFRDPNPLQKENRSGTRFLLSDGEKWISLRSEGVVPEKTIAAKIRSISKIGFSVEIPSGEKPLIGFVYSVLEFNTTFHCVRDGGHEWIFVLDSFQDNGSRWYEFLGKNTPLLIEEVKDSESVSQLLTECGFIKGQRRKYYTKTSTIGFVDRWLKDSTLFKRFVERFDETELASHVSAVRVSGAGWLIQEGATGIHKRSGIRSVMERVLSQLKTEHLTQGNSASLYGTIYDPKIKPVHSMWTALLSSRGLRLKCGHVDSAEFVSLPSESNQKSNYELCSLDRFSYVELLRESPDLFHEFFGVFEVKSESSEINRRYKNLSPQYGVELKCLRDCKGVLVAIVYRLKGPYALNSSGLVNSVFVYWVDYEAKSFNAAMREVFESEICHGTKDVLVLGLDRVPDLKYDRVFDLVIDRIKNWSEARGEHETAA